MRESTKKSPQGPSGVTEQKNRAKGREGELAKRKVLRCTICEQEFDDDAHCLMNIHMRQHSNSELGIGEEWKEREHLDADDYFEEVKE